MTLRAGTEAIETLESSSRSALDTIDTLHDYVLEGRGGRIQTINLHHFALCTTDHRFRAATDAADRVTADGWPIVAFMRARSTPVSRVTGSQFVRDLLTDRRYVGKRVGVLGGSKHSVDRFEEHLRVAGIHLVFRDTRYRQEWTAPEIAERLTEANVELLLVAVTPPFGEIIAHEIVANGFDGSVIGVGGAVDMVTGAQKQAPRAVRVMHLEWAYRLAGNPRRLWRRYLIECIPVFVTVLLPSILLRAAPRDAA